MEKHGYAGDSTNISFETKIITVPICLLTQHTVRSRLAK